jgi:hypothetical protein
MRGVGLKRALIFAAALVLAAAPAMAAPTRRPATAKSSHAARASSHAKAIHAKAGRDRGARPTRAAMVTCARLAKPKRAACLRRHPPTPVHPQIALKPFNIPTPLPDSALPESGRGVTHGVYASCGDAPDAFVKAAAVNAKTLDTLEWAPFGAPEHGWQVYDLLIGREIGTSCGSGTPVYAQKLAAFQARYQLPADGVMTPATFEVFKGVLQEKRSFVMDRVHGICPDAPADAQLVVVPKSAETFEREDRKMRADVWAAYSRMVAAARAELPALAADPKALTIFSAYRSPESDAARCDAQGNCDGLRRAVCSAHRTGAAMDLNVGWIPGVAADSTTPENRLLQTRMPAYRWLVANAARFGFVNYPYEPWHWEYVGDPALAAATPPHGSPEGRAQPTVSDPARLKPVSPPPPAASTQAPAATK